MFSIVPGVGPRRSGSLALLPLLLLTAVLAAPPGASPAQTVTVRDDLRREVEVPVPAARILSLQPEVTRIIVALGAGERLVGLDSFIRDNDHLFDLVFAGGKRLPVVSTPDGGVNKEFVARLQPSLVFVSPTEQQVPDSIQRSLGIPVLAMASMGRIDGLLGEIELLGKVTGRTERAAGLTEYFRKKLEGLAGLSLTTAPAAKPRVYLAFWSSLLRTPVFYEPVELAGGANVAGGLLPSYLGTIGAVVSLERIVRWDPDVILVQGNYLPKDRLVTVDSLLEDPRLRAVKAVREGRVHYTFGFWYWWDPACVLAETLYLAKLFQPVKLASLDVEAEGNAIFREFYGQDGLFTTLAEVLDFNGWTAR